MSGQQGGQREEQPATRGSYMSFSSQHGPVESFNYLFCRYNQKCVCINKSRGSEMHWVGGGLKNKPTKTCLAGSPMNESAIMCNV